MNTPPRTLASFTCGLGLALALLATAACSVKPLRLQVPEGLAQTSTALSVTGRYGWRPDRQSLRFGDFSTGPRQNQQQVRAVRCEPTCTGIEIGGYAWRVEEGFRAVKQQLSFTQRGPAQAEALVLALYELSQQETRLLLRVMSVEVQTTTRQTRRAAFAGTVQPQRPDEQGWRFAIWFPDQLQTGAPDIGFIQSDAGQRIAIRHLSSWESQPRGSQLALKMGLPMGFAFELDGVTVGAVSIVGDGQVWLRNDLAPSVRLALASLSSAVLARPT